MRLSLSSGAARLRKRPLQRRLTTIIFRHIIASSVNISKTHVPRQYIRLTDPTQASLKHHAQLVQSQKTLSLQLLHPANFARSFAQTPSLVIRSQLLIHRSSQPSSLGGDFFRRTAASVLAAPTSTLPSLLKSFVLRCSLLTHSSAFTMSTLSQPQTPAALDSPLREHRHRPVERLTDRLETPSLDDRSYRVIRLPNQLEVLLVHDADTDKASAAMDVNVGNFSDEEDLPGTAHAVECEIFFPLVNFYE
jgi:hypothetical protein